MLRGLKVASDGTLEIYIQRSPGRICRPKAAALDGSWEPPPVERGEPLSEQN